MSFENPDWVYPKENSAARTDEGLILAIRSKRHQNRVLRASKVEVVLICKRVTQTVTITLSGLEL